MITDSSDWTDVRRRTMWVNANYRELNVNWRKNYSWKLTAYSWQFTFKNYQCCFGDERESSGIDHELEEIGPQADGRQVLINDDRLMITDFVHTENADDADVRKRTLWENVNYRELFVNWRKIYIYPQMTRRDTDGGSQADRGLGWILITDSSIGPKARAKNENL